MFSRPIKGPTPRHEGAEAPARNPAIAASLVAENVTLTGDLISDGDVQLDGVMLGDIRVHHLTIGETGRVEGLIEADSVDVRGRVQGAITARTVRLAATAQVDGDITQAELSIEAGAHFAGRSLAHPPQLPLTLIAAAE